jgi:hypothetical protein
LHFFALPHPPAVPAVLPLSLAFSFKAHKKFSTLLLIIQAKIILQSKINPKEKISLYIHLKGVRGRRSLLSEPEPDRNEVWADESTSV